MSEMYFVSPTAESEVALETLGLDELVQATEGLGKSATIVTSQKLKRGKTKAGRPVWGVLEGNAEMEAHRTLVNARHLGLQRFDVLADRLSFITDFQNLTDQSTICLLDCSVADLESVWQFMLTIKPENMPFVHVHLTRVFAPELVLEARKLCDISDRIAFLLTRFNSRGVLQSGRLKISASQPELAQRFQDLGWEAIYANFGNLAQVTTNSPALVTKLATPELMNRLGLQDATIFVSDGLVGSTKAELSDLDSKVFGLSEINRQLGRFKSVIVDQDLLDLVLSCRRNTKSGLLKILGGPPQEFTEDANNSMSAAEFVGMVFKLRDQAGIAKPKPVVLQIANSWWGQGSSHVFEAQLRYLAERGYSVYAVHFDIDDSGFYNPQATEDVLLKLPQDGAVHRWQISRDGSLSQAEKALNLSPPFSVDMLSVEGESRIARNASIPPHLRDTLKALQPDWVLMNYSQNHPLLRALDLESVPSIVETHDLRTIQHAIYAEQSVDPIDYSLELDNASRFDGLLFISSHEEQITRERLPDLKGVSAFPFMIGNSGIEQRQLHESAATPFLRALSSSGKNCLPLLQRLMDQPSANSDARKIALFVGSSHKANVISLDWYIANVHLPYKIYEHLELLVAGNISGEYADCDLPGITFLGRVDDLAGLYERTDIVILPIRAGTGLPIKVIDTLVSQKPFVCTPNGIRAISELRDQWPAFEDSSGFAAELLKFARDPEYLEAMTAKLKSICNPEESWRDYTAKWDRLVEDVTGASPPDHQPLSVIREPRVTPLPGAILAQGRQLSFRHDHILWESEGLKVEGNSDQYNFSQAYGRLSLHFALADNPAGKIRINGLINTNKTPDTCFNFFVNGVPAGCISADDAYHKPIVLFADTIRRGGTGVVVLEVLITTNDGVPIKVGSERWLALDKMTLSLADN